MAAASVPPNQQDFSPGLLLTHDWRQLHTPCGLLDTTIKEVDSPASSSYQTDTFTITNAFQYEAFVNDLGRCDVDAKKNCPLQLVSGNDSENVGDCGERPLSAIVKMTFKVTHALSETVGESPLSECVIKDLQDIESHAIGSEVPKDKIVQLLRKFGSHFSKGSQRLGKCFSRIVVVEQQCNMDLLHEIAGEVFAICDRYEARIPGSHEGLWYSLHNVLDCASWTDEKRRLLQSARLCVTQHGHNRSTMCFTQWKKNDFVERPVKVDRMKYNLMAVWDLIEQSPMKFQDHTKLASMIKEEWQQLAEGTQHSCSVPLQSNVINIRRVCWDNLLDDLEMQEYFPAKITLQDARSLHIHEEGPVLKTYLLWKVLNQVILLNSTCREEDISKFEKETINEISNTDLLEQACSGFVDKSEEIPHPMDVTLLVFLCSDFMLRQVLAKKLFMCCLAIPFIVPTREDTVQILLWPLRSIVLEWRNKQEAKEEALVTCKLNMVGFMRFGQTRFSKSKLMNTILSSRSHETFFHKNSPCGNEKREISNGTVEMSHFLPSASKSDHFSEPALFFNLRGDACDYPVQHSLMMDLATTLVILFDVQELNTKQVQVLLRATVTTKQEVILILTDSHGLKNKELAKLLTLLRTVLGDTINRIKIVITFQDGKKKNVNAVSQEVREGIKSMMKRDPPCSLEDFAALSNTCLADETEQHCSAGKSVADKIVSEIKELDICARKARFLPQQGQQLTKTGKLLRELHRCPAKDEKGEKEKIKTSLKDIRESQASESRGNGVMKKVISMFHEPIETKRFAMRWVQLELDALSRTVLPEMHSRKNQKWKEMMKAKDEKKDSVSLEQEISKLEKQIDAATFGMEHVMREMVQLYDVAANLGRVDTDSEYNLSSLPDIAGHLLLEGQPVELMDGDHGFIALSWVKAVFRSLAKLVGEKKRIFVLSIMGIQSSGKSTLLNTLFGLEFAVSAGRCTRGIYAQLLPVANGSQLPFDYMLVLDSEGLRAQELGQHNYEHDNELATLVVGLSDLALINMKGENVMEITDILQIVVLAFLRMKLANSYPRKQCMFIHQNVSAVNAEEKLAVERQRFEELLNRMTKQASESQGLHQSIISFSQVISFDGQQDVVYFSDLWQGDPPMAPVNTGYSTRAAETQQRILREVAQNRKTVLTISDFIGRIEDMWKGVLADDFIFHFRNSVAAKAFLDLERVFARLTMKMEEKLLRWVNTTCNVQMHNCHTETDVDSKFTELNLSLHERVGKLLTKSQSELDTFFKNYPAQEVILQWETEKKLSLRMIGDAVRRRMHMKLDNMRIRRRVEVKQQQMSHRKEKDIMSQAIALAEELRGNCDNEKLEEKFDEVYSPWAEEFIKECHQNPEVVIDVLYILLLEMFPTFGNQRFLNTELKQNSETSHAPTETNTSLTLTKDHISIKDLAEPSSRFKGVVKAAITDDTVLNDATEQANVMMKVVMDEVESISQQDLMFDQHHGRQVINFALNEVTKCNDNKNIRFSFTPQFRAMFALHVVHRSAPTFESMNQKFEEKHGIRAKLNDFRQRVFKQFRNAVQDASTEVTISDDFCEAIKGPLIAYVRLMIDQQVVRELYQAIGITKYDLITKMLDDIAETRDFSKMYTYVHTPDTYSREWVETFGKRLIFGKKDGESRYKHLVHTFVEDTIVKVTTSTRAATQSNPVDMESVQYGEWITRFYEDMEETISLDTQQLEVTGTTIKDFNHLQKCLEDNLKDLGGNMKKILCQATAESVIWANEENPFQRVHQRLWGCRRSCPFCQEPCRYSDQVHTSHSCIQHRPSGVTGTTHRQTHLDITTCNTLVASHEKFNCCACSFECRKTPHCTETRYKLDPIHPYREYKKFLPRWDIAPDPSGEATKFWKWAMCTFQDELVEKYKSKYDVAGVEIPESWREITEKEARDSLRVFFQ